MAVLHGLIVASLVAISTGVSFQDDGMILIQMSDPKPTSQAVQAEGTQTEKNNHAEPSWMEEARLNAKKASEARESAALEHKKSQANVLDTMKKIETEKLERQKHNAAVEAEKSKAKSEIAEAERKAMEEVTKEIVKRKEEEAEEKKHRVEEDAERAKQARDLARSHEGEFEKAVQLKNRLKAVKESSAARDRALTEAKRKALQIAAKQKQKHN
mmetsp:Transcript_37486/g.84522  ORF Transcript_37486/g.84522 Transcript_37486/m.84522 type:complete len:214 (-) Transcript_37486:178-819(-)|eukprot:CAMPEP_0197887456 /NCGR_PEP_ID=MMETSP1439-20131203/19435_1 /TAXON_ID=66791 /ORGANISM="Gonyaulax spinifera, Strain CCMP409" /LENGTH=213 /DNA_ID=CAMNT_0043507303 /DNA_START=73 /DNA_END=714 /DNA_ORIENTATION=-